MYNLFYPFKPLIHVPPITYPLTTLPTYLPTYLSIYIYRCCRSGAGCSCLGPPNPRRCRNTPTTREP